MDNEQYAYSSDQEQALQTLTSIVGLALRHEASDVHLRSERCLAMRVDGKIGNVNKDAIFTESRIKNLFFPLMSTEMIDIYHRNMQVDFSLSDANQNRVRVNLFRQRRSIAGVMRILPAKISNPQNLRLPKQVTELIKAQSGLVLFAGVIGSGKSTSLASVLQEINQQRYRHIFTIEDPIEHLFTEDKCMVTQREIGIDVADFSTAKMAILREDPDIVYIGELRDTQSIEVALNLAETGHLVLTTMHASSTIDAITKIVSYFPGTEQDTIRNKIAQVLFGVVSQRLVRKKQERGRVVVCEVLRANALVRECIQEARKIPQLRDIIQKETHNGEMLYFDNHLRELVSEEVISVEEALKHASNLTDLVLKLKGF